VLENRYRCGRDGRAVWRRQSGGSGGEELAVVKHSRGARADS
jgi:hypothetical protein